MNTGDIQGLNIWYNTKILKDNKPDNKKVIIFIHDLLNKEGHVLSFETFENKYDIKISYTMHRW